MKYTLRDLLSDFPDDDACLEWIKAFRFPEGITCCRGITKHYKVKGRRAYACEYCGHHFYPTAGTIWHKSSTPLTLWFYAAFVMANTRSGISAAQLQREIGVTYKTAWRMFHQIRTLMGNPSEQLSGQVEIDETFVHPNPYKNSRAGRKYGYDARRTGSVVFGMVERGGKAKVWHVKSAGERTLIPLIREHVKPGTLIHTDGFPAYRKLPEWGYPHRTTNHGKGEYYTPDSYTQNIENVWSHFKRGIKGVYRSISTTYLQAYAQEYAWRYSHRNSVSCFWSLMAEIAPLSSEDQRTVS